LVKITKKWASFARALHSELELEISSRVSCRDKFSAISKVRVEHHFFVIFSKILENSNFRNSRKRKIWKKLMHSKLELKILSRNKFLQFFAIYLWFFCNFFTIFCNFFAIFCNFWCQKWLNWVQISELFSELFCKIFASSESTDITKIFPKFEKRQFPKLAKTKNSEKNVLLRALSSSDLIYSHFGQISRWMEIWKVN